MTLRTRIARIALVPAAAALLAVTAACGGGSSAASPTTRPQVQTKAGNATQSVATVHTDHAAEIDQQNMTFTPARVSIKVGESVLIKNSETTIHTANINGKNITGNMKKGDSTAWTAPAAGTYKVSCDYHPQMSATITVT
jgi:plastocyanin